MKRKGKGRGFPWLTLTLVAGLALLAGYLLGTQKGPGHRETRQAITAPARSDTTGEALQSERGREREKPGDLKDDCLRIEEGVREFCRFLNRRNYVQQIEEGIDTCASFKGIMMKLSSRPPIPAGEGMDSSVMTSNVFHFFRVLERKELRVIKEVLENEGAALEMNLDLFFEWITRGNRCPDSEGTRPSLEVLYPYAGFLLNTVGGRAYLFRRQTGIRLLVSYYCLLIVHEANTKGKNSYGIDILPHIGPLAREISSHREFRFQKEYVQRLEALERHYAMRR